MSRSWKTAVYAAQGISLGEIGSANGEADVAEPADPPLAPYKMCGEAHVQRLVMRRMGND